MTLKLEDLIKFDSDRRQMECALSEEEREQRGKQSFDENAARKKLESERDALEEEAQAKKAEAKAVDQRVRQKQSLIDSLSEAARSGRETRPVDVCFYYDPRSHQVLEVRGDTKEVLIAGRQATATEMDKIKPRLQRQAEGTGEPCRKPRDIPGIDKDLVEGIAEEIAEGTPLTLQLLGYRLGKRNGGLFKLNDDLIDEMLKTLSLNVLQPVQLTKSERWVFRAGLEQAIKEADAAEATEATEGEGEGEDDGEEDEAEEGAEGPTPRKPRDIPGVNLSLLAEIEEGQESAQTLENVGRWLGWEQRDSLEYSKLTAEELPLALVRDFLTADAKKPIELTPEEHEAFAAGVRMGVDGPLVTHVKQNIQQIEEQRAAAEAAIDLAEVKRRIDLGESKRAIAKELGIPESTLRKRLKDAE